MPELGLVLLILAVMVLVPLQVVRALVRRGHRKAGQVWRPPER